MPHRSTSGKRSVLPAHPAHALAARAEARRYSDLWCVTAGVPCQDVSVAGKRAGLAGQRTGLFYDFARILRELRPAWFVFENVPGLLSSNRGRDFAEVQRVLMVECGYGICWRVLDSRYFGVAQRRRRVFIVGRFGKPCPPEILFEPARGTGDFTPRGETRQNFTGPLGGGSDGTGRKTEFEPNIVCGTIAGGAHPGGFNGRDAETGNIIATLRSEYGEQSYRGDGADPIVAATLPADRRLLSDGIADNLRVGFCLPSEHRGVGNGHNTNYVSALSPVRGGPDDNDAQAGHLVSTPPDADGVRDTTRLPEGMDYPDSWPLLPSGEDSSRYRSLGNAVTVQVIYWIARQIIRYEDSH